MSEHKFQPGNPKLIHADSQADVETFKNNAANSDDETPKC